jgi:hypothetical protein
MVHPLLGILIVSALGALVVVIVIWGSSIMNQNIKMSGGNRRSLDEDRIICTCDPWTLACAVGAVNGTNGLAIDYDHWFKLSQSNWLPEIQHQTGASVAEIRTAVHNFAKANKHLHLHNALHSICAARGLPSPIALTPGESATLQFGKRKDSRQPNLG